MMTDFDRITKAIHFIKDNFKQQPELDKVAAHIHLSPFHFQRLFKNWAGVSPKKFLQYISIEYSKQLLAKKLSLADVSFETGLSGTSRLHDLFINIEGMTPGEYKNAGENLAINYSHAETPFGDVLIASTAKGICHLSFINNTAEGIQELQQSFQQASFVQKTDLLQQNALKIFNHDWSDLQQIKLHLKGTEFQLKVWQALLQIPSGSADTYSGVADKIHLPKASRTVGTAIGNNPVAFLIPCHRVIRSTGVTGEYRWHSDRKTALLGWEAAQVFGE
jgi:AraC family transcriptional regulator, regulatory protein of adaptative response / methylated-DNA-[protein]-cysteine methyltransferase